MKLLKYITFVTLVFCNLSCNIEKFEADDLDASITNNDTNNSAVFRVAIDGETFVADNPVATVIDDVINISGIKTSTGEIITLTVFGNAVGRYQLGVTQNQVEVNAASYTNQLDGTGDTWIAATDFITPQGEVNIVEIDRENETISGTFSFTGHNVSLPQIAFTSGVFTNVSFAGGLVTTDSNNMFSAKVDGVEFTADAINAVQTTLSNMSTIGIVATKNTMETLSITVDANIEPGDYQFGGINIPTAQYNLSLTDANIGEGSFTITTHDTTNRRIVGTFSFTASPLLSDGASFEITEGSFDVTYF